MSTRRQLLQGAAALTALAAQGMVGAAAQPRLRCILLGTQGGPNANPTRAETSALLSFAGLTWLVDCGYGALAGLIRTPFNYRDVDRVFLTHLHDDHTADLVSLIGHQWTGGRVKPTVVHGPTGTRRLVEAAIRYNEVNEEVRLVDEARSARIASLFSAQEIAASATPAEVLREGSLAVRAVENTHYPAASKQHTTQRSLSLRFDAPGRGIVFSGDTAYSAGLVALARGADVLVCEVMHLEATRRSFDERVKAGAYADNPEGIWKHIVETHTTLDVAGRMAREAGVRKLVLYHVIPGGWNPEYGDDFYAREVAREFSGEIVVGRDGLEI